MAIPDARGRSPEQRVRDGARLTGVHGHLALAVDRILQIMEVAGWPMMVVEGVRSDLRQQALFAQGRTTPGNIVTKIDGVTKKSMHQKQVDGMGHAVDLAFLDDPGTTLVETYAETQPWTLFGTLAEAYNLTWGGRWASFPDRPHVELSLSAKV